MFDQATFIKRNILEQGGVIDTTGAKTRSVMNVLDACGVGIDAVSVAKMASQQTEGQSKTCELKRSGEYEGYLEAHDGGLILLINSVSSYVTLTIDTDAESRGACLCTISYDEDGKPIRYSIARGESTDKMHVDVYEGESIQFAVDYCTTLRGGDAPADVDLFSVFTDERAAIAPDSTIEELSLADQEAVRKLIGRKQKTNS